MNFLFQRVVSTICYTYCYYWSLSQYIPRPSYEALVRTKSPIFSSWTLNGGFSIFSFEESRNHKGKTGYPLTKGKHLETKK